MSVKKNLIISVVGDNSLHRHWIKSGNRAFDLLLIYFGENAGKYSADADYYITVRGLFKLESIAHGIEKYKDDVRRYDAVWLPDDDMIISTSAINNMFGIFHKYDLDLAQPTILAGRTLPIARTDPRYLLRFVNFVEMACPIFKTGLLFDVLPFFKLNRSGWGIDQLWSKYFEDRKKRMAVIDCVDLMHISDWSRGAYYKKLASLGIDSDDERDKIEKEYGLDLNDIKELGSIKLTWPAYIALKIERKIKRMTIDVAKERERARTRQVDGV